MFKLFLKSFFLYFLIVTNVFANQDFNQWLKKFQTKAINSGISEEVVVNIMSTAKFLQKVIEYDRYQPEFYEDTFTYIKKRSSNRKVKEGLKLFKKRKNYRKNWKWLPSWERIITSFNGYRNKFGKYLGKMDIVFLATLSYDKRRSEFLQKNY